MKKVIGNIVMEKESPLSIGRITNTETGFSMTTSMGFDGGALANTLLEFRAAEARHNLTTKKQ